MNKHFIIGIIIAVTVQTLVNYTIWWALPTPTNIQDSIYLIAIQSSVAALLGCTAGAFAARGSFMPAAIGIWFISWLIALYVVLSFGITLSYFNFLQVNAVAVIGSLICSFFGVHIGYWLRIKTSVASPAT